MFLTSNLQCILLNHKPCFQIFVYLVKFHYLLIRYDLTFLGIHKLMLYAASLSQLDW